MTEPEEYNYGWEAVDGYIIRNQQEIIEESTRLLKLARAFMNKVPDRKYGRNYKLCAEIDKFLGDTE